MTEILVGRQPIFDRDLSVLGYELLFSGPGDAQAPGPLADAHEATSRVVLNAFLDLGVERVVGDHLAFLNLSREFLLGELPSTLDPAQVVLEVREDVVPDGEVLAAIARLRHNGSNVALDGYTGRVEHRAFLDQVDLVKVDCQAVESTGLRDLVADLRQRSLRLVAEKIETQAELREYRELGFDLFQGHFLMRPDIVRGRAVPARRLTLLRLLGRMQDPKLDFDELAELIGQDVTLVYRLLRYVNSAAMGLRRRIEAPREGLVALGLERTRSIVSLLAISAIDDKPSELVHSALVRGRMCELLARSQDPGRTAAHFTAGLLSVLDALTDLPMEEIVTQLPLAEDVAGALLSTGSGKVRQVLDVVRAYERCDWTATVLPGVPAAALLEAYYHAIGYARDLEPETRSAA